MFIQENGIVSCDTAVSHAWLPPSSDKARKKTYLDLCHTRMQTSFMGVFRFLVVLLCTISAINLSVKPQSCHRVKAEEEDLSTTGRGLRNTAACPGGVRGGSAGMALVLYDDKAVSPFHRKTRELSFGGYDITVFQDWQTAGVAAVVWDAVCNVKTMSNSITT